MTGKSDVWLAAGVVWAAPCGSLTESVSQDLTLQAIALAAKTANWRLLFDYRRSRLTHDVLALNRHAELLCRQDLPRHARLAMLCRHRSTDFQFWERVLSLRGLSAAAFTEGEAAVDWLQASPPPATESPANADSTPLPIDVAAVKRQLRQFAMERKDAPRSLVIAELTELVECLLTLANNLGIVPLRNIAAGNSEPGGAVLTDANAGARFDAPG